MQSVASSPDGRNITSGSDDRTIEGGLLYWVPHDCRKSVHSPAVMTIPLTSRKGTVSLDFDDFALEHHGVKFSKMHLSRIWYWVDLEPKRRYTVDVENGLNLGKQS